MKRPRGTPEPTREDPARRRRSAAFLVRFWREPDGNGAAGDETLRGFVRNLRNGEEAFLGYPEQLPTVIRAALGELPPEGQSVFGTAADGAERTDRQTSTNNPETKRHS